MEIIRTVENSELGVKRTLDELDVNRSSFYDWYRRYEAQGYDGLGTRKSIARKFWNKIPDTEKDQVVSIALEYPEKSPRELAWHITDTEDYYHFRIERISHLEGRGSLYEPCLHRHGCF